MSRLNRLAWVCSCAVLFASCSAGTGGRRGGPGGDGSVTGDGAAGGADGAPGGGDGGVSDGDGGVTDGDGGVTDGDGGGPVTCGSMENCGNGLDDDCNGMVDEGCGCAIGATQPCYAGNPAQAGRGVCTLGMQTCEPTSTEFGTWSACSGSGMPRPLDCTMPGIDNDCDGAPDVGCDCMPGETRACYDGPAGTDGVGVCHGGTETCAATASGSAWGPCTGEITPSMEMCDGMDYDCDGVPNSGCGCVVGSSRSCYDGPAGTSGVGLCHDGVETCMSLGAGMSSWGACTGEVLPGVDMCDGIDSACTGAPGATCVCIIGRTQPCYDGPGGTRGVGVCRDGTQTCVAAAGGGSMWSAACSGETLPGSEICGNGIDDNCSGAVDEGCGGTLMCPGDVSVNAGTPVVLTATGTMIVSWTWTIVSGPVGGAATAVWAPTPPRSATETFTPTIVGDYVIRVSAVDTAGRTLTCMFTVHALSHGLRVELTWDGSGDIDLHLHDSTTTPWFAAPQDCYYANTVTPWGANLDFDNTVSSGPENDRVDTPAVATNYTIGVHNYSLGAGRIATVRVFCGSTTTTIPTMTFTSRALTGATAGNCTANDFWKVATVRFTSATTCTITPINTYSPSSARCTAF